MEHKHEPIVGLDGIIRCKDCGEFLPYAEEEITKVSSSRRAKRTLEEIAVSGRYQATSFENGFVVYSREKNGIREEVTGQRLSERNYRIFKRIISVQGG